VEAQLKGLSKYLYNEIIQYANPSHSQLHVIHLAYHWAHRIHHDTPQDPWEHHGLRAALPRITHVSIALSQSLVS
jgi:hypothetical protein